MPCISAHICLEPNHGKALHEALAALTTNLTQKSTSQLHQGKLVTNNQPLRKKRPPPWNNIGPEVCLEIKEADSRWKEEVATKTSATNEEPTAPSFETHKLRCAVCGTPKQVRTKPLTGLTWRQFNCCHCKVPKRHQIGFAFVGPPGICVRSTAG